MPSLEGLRQRQLSSSSQAENNDESNRSTQEEDDEDSRMAYGSSSSSKRQRPVIAAAIQRSVSGGSNRPLKPYFHKILAVLVVTALYTAFLYKHGSGTPDA